MSRRFSLAHLTVLDLSPPDVVRAAAASGFDAFGLRLHPVRPGDVPAPVRGDTPMRRELLSLMADTGLSMLDVEAFRLDDQLDFSTVEPTLEAAARLGARNALVFIDEKATDRAADLFARFCDIALPYGIDASLEFMPWLGIGTLADALEVDRLASRGNARLLFDTLHVARSGTALSAVAAVPASKLAYAQICDAPSARPASLELIADEARFHRLFPGDGELPVAEFIAALPPDIILAPEVATTAIAATVSGAERARRALVASKRAVAAAEALRSA